MTRGEALRSDPTQGATFVELFFDLVFVFAITQLTSTVLHNLTWSGVGHAALLFWLVWWAWTQFTWTLNSADTEQARVRLPVLLAAAVSFFLAQSVPDAFGDGGTWFAVSYVVVRAMGLAMQELIHVRDQSKRLPISVWSLGSSVGLVLVLVGGWTDPDARVWWWLGAMVADFVAAGVAGRGEWEIAPGHFAERHGLIVIIALGESLIAAGVASANLPRDLAFAVTTVGAVASACALWWMYFGAFHGRLERSMAATADTDRGAWARDVFSLAHAAIVAGVIGIAIGFEVAVAHPDDPLPRNAALALSLGLALFAGGAALAAFRAGIRTGIAPRVAFVVIVLVTIPLIPNLAAGATMWAVALLATGVAIVDRDSADEAVVPAI